MSAAPPPPAHPLAEWLLGRGPVPPAAQLRAWRLAAYAYTALPPDHPARAPLRPDYLAALARHVRIREELLPLVRAWRAAGVDVLLYKGFHLAELVYPVPGARFHGDVDVLLRPEQAEEALRIAASAGWAVRAEGLSARPSHASAAFVADSPGGVVQLDAHVLALTAQLPWRSVQRRITGAVWARSAEVEWEGVRVREMARVDSLLVGLVLERCWSGDAWGTKPADAVDLRVLAHGGGVSREALEARARELGCARTLEVYLGRLDPWAERLDLSAPDPRQVRRWNRRVFRERGLLGAPERLARLALEPWLPGYVAAALPTLFRVRRSLARQRDLRALLRELTPAAPARPGPAWRRYRLLRGVRAAVRLFPTNARGDCVARSLTLFHLLRREGWPVVFVSGVRRRGGAVEGHAWVELDGHPLAGLGDEDAPRWYAVGFRHPEPPGAGASDLQGAGPQHEPAQLQAPQ